MRVQLRTTLYQKVKLNSFALANKKTLEYHKNFIEIVHKIPHSPELNTFKFLEYFNKICKKNRKLVSSHNCIIVK